VNHRQPVTGDGNFGMSALLSLFWDIAERLLLDRVSSMYHRNSFPAGIQ
jgi:hypothetical protein